ncbi:MAG: elongation factor Ts [Chitinivibrionales bacterium]|nr:elongation factor Ts [Chitinivibrionales bacterium]
MTISAQQVRELREKTGLGMMTCKQALTETDGDMEKAIENLRKQGQATASKRAGKAANEGQVSIIIGDSDAIMFEINCETDFVARGDDFIALADAAYEAIAAARPKSLEEAKALKSDKLGGISIEEKVVELMGKIGEKITFRRYIYETCDSSSEKFFSYIHGGGKIGVLVKILSDNGSALASDAAASVGKDCAMQIAASVPLGINRESISPETVEKEKEIYFTQAKNSGKPEKVWDKIVEGKLNKYFKEATLYEQEFIKDTDKSVSQRIEEGAKEAGASLNVVWFKRFELGGEE